LCILQFSCDSRGQILRGEYPTRVFPPGFEDAQDRKMAEKIGLLAEGGKKY
jgi:hypothetical protein